ncbi:TBC1 domain family member 23-like [Chelonus insularis]|uniref:TBC1 domain family member 23-like n=1 Tax=Chelonus insularis TaxID=460826 RepID=UPI0015894830|nr:TBC1 domain family member 23-like [Chelonus insularis]
MSTPCQRSSTSSTNSSSSLPESNSTKCPIVSSEIIPDDKRLDVWMACLNIPCDNNKPLERLDSEEMDTVPNLGEIVDFATGVADRIELAEHMKASMRFEIIRIISYHCGETQQKFNPIDGWHDLLEPIIYLAGSEVLKYKIFKAILKRYIPQHDYYESIIRFLVIYHDPQLHTFLKSKEMTLRNYPFIWINRLFAGLVSPPVIFTMWDRYFIEKNRFLIFFLSAALMITFRDDIMSYKNEDKDTLIFALWALPTNINAENLSDFFALADRLKNTTPPSFINRLCPVIFDDKKDENSLFDTICWSVTVEELVKSMEKTSILSAVSKNIRFFIIDCRSQEEFDAGHLPTAYFLDYNLRITNPIKFSDNIEKLRDLQTSLLKNDIKARHFCFIDSGREEHKNYTDMVIRSCQRRDIKYINLLVGGYKALHEYVGNDVDNFFASHNAQRCAVCKENAPPVTMNRLERLKSQGEEFVNRLRTSKSTYSVEEETPGPSRMARSKSMYENPHTSISKWLEDPNLVTYFECKELDNSNKHHDCDLVITKDHLIALRKMRNREDAAEISVRRPLTSIISIKAKKKNKNVIVIKYDEASKADDFVVNNASEFLFSDSAKAMRFFSGEYFRTLLIPYSTERFFNQNN